MKLALLAAAAIALTATPATTRTAGDTTSGPVEDRHAIVLRDGPGDVWTFSDFAVGYELAAQPAADVLRARVTHGSNAVSIRMVFDDLQRVDTQWYRCHIRIQGRPTARFVLEAKKGHWVGTAWQELEGEWVLVPGLGHSIDYASDTVTLRVARTLLGRPSWVRVRLWNELGLPDGSTFFTDNPTTATPHPAFTPPLRSS